LSPVAWRALPGGPVPLCSEHLVEDSAGLLGELGPLGWPGRSLPAWSTRSAMAIWRRARLVCGLHPVQGGLAPSLRSSSASMSRAWWHHAALPADGPVAARFVPH
jgi:hypothetical protein